MTGVKQTIFIDDPEGRNGNCLQACVASILELELDKVPHFVDLYKEEWFYWFDRWLRKNFGIAPLRIEAKAFRDVHSFQEHYSILTGQSPRDASKRHSVVGFEHNVVFDPHPSNDGIGELAFETVFVYTGLPPSDD